MTIDASLEIRKLPVSHLNQLSSILEGAEQWKKLMAIVPNILIKDNFESCINPQNPAKYNSDHIRLIEEASQKYKKRGTEILLDEWGCSGRIRPAVGHLLHLLIQAELFRAADYVAESILNISRPPRPLQGPAAPIPVDINMEDLLNLNDSRNETQENLFESENQTEIEMSNKTSGSINLSSNIANLPISDLFNGLESNQNISQVYKSDENNVPIISLLNQSSENPIPIISELNQYSHTSFNNDNLPNLSELNQPSINIPIITELGASDENITSNSCFIPNFSMLTSMPQGDEPDSTNNNSEENSFLPDLNVLVPETSRRSSLNVLSTTLNTSKSQQCTSPLPTLTLNTHLPHFAYEEIEIATNNFNEEPFKGLDSVGRFLGAGAFGKVFLAHNLLDQPVAVKKLILENAEVVNVDDRVTKQFKTEVEILSKFKHKNLLSLLGYSCDGCTYCLLYEYISGGTLKDRLQCTDNKLTWQERLTIALGTAKAITYLHTAFSSPLIHRDIKTANILLDCSNKPKLGDFGITMLLDNRNTHSLTVIGTSEYMAPEASRGDISIKSDTFSFGVVLLELLTSLPPYDSKRDGNDLVTHVDGICEESIQPLLDTSIGSWINEDVNFGEELYVIANKCLEEKKKRPFMADVTNMVSIMIGKL